MVDVGCGCVPARIVAGGIAWHDVQVVFSSTVLLRCSVGLTDVEVYPVWQSPQVSDDGCGAAGGIAWHAPHGAFARSTWTVPSMCVAATVVDV